MSQFQEAQNTFRFPDIVAGTTLEAQAFEVLINDAAPSVQLDTVTCVFAKDGVATITPTVTITSAANWQFTVDTVDPADTAVVAGLHTGDIKTTDVDGNVAKYIKVEINVLPSPQA